MFEKEKLLAGELTAQIKDYIKARVELLLLKLSDRLSRILSGILSMILVAIFFLFFLFFISIALAKFLGGLFNNDTLGYLVVALIYFVFILVIVYLKDKLITEPLTNKIMESFNFNKELDE